MCYECTGNEKLPLLILYGEENPELQNIKEDNVKAIRIRYSRLDTIHILRNQNFGLFRPHPPTL